MQANARTALGVVIGVLALAGLGSLMTRPAPRPDPVAAYVSPEEIAASSSGAPARSSFEQAAVEAMKRKIRAEAGVSDVLYQGGAFVRWQVGVATGETAAYAIDRARVICRQLRDGALVDGDTDVRIVDLRGLKRSDGDFRGSSLGHVRCSDGEILGI